MDGAGEDFVHSRPVLGQSAGLAYPFEGLFALLKKSAPIVPLLFDAAQGVLFAGLQGAYLLQQLIMEAAQFSGREGCAVLQLPGQGQVLPLNINFDPVSKW